MALEVHCREMVYNNDGSQNRIYLHVSLNRARVKSQHRKAEMNSRPMRDCTTYVSDNMQSVSRSEVTLIT